ncbi:trypsin-like peptidase domain-containing protein [Pelomonas sp. CA6]|uniref:S1C family serine protease n=1 Tax=Pelomonas sp. CA6 TaxID=2907999 RepID=UPI001F4A0F41|nr:trypsin-like peptidase domain-containing protein [Pelomonas sp. CA6]MCH7341933.1 trypsin-like peptidase domain-containing protein [Pelomonas sp. CA6]
MRKTWLIFSQATTVALAGYFVVATLKPQWLQNSPTLPAPSLPVLGAPANPPARVAGQASYAEAARVASPAVVAVSAFKVARPRDGGEGLPDDGWHRFPFGTPGRPPMQRGLGSGVIVSEQGYLLTNNHVVAGASDIQIQLSDGRELRAQLVGTDPETDLAVLRVELAGLPVIPLGRAEDLRVGDVVLAIGNPFDVGQTVTSGIVSALGRSSMGINTFENFIQTDAAINPGNSGGALVDAQGRLVGINTAIYSRRGGGSLGIGFAIPVDIARQVLEALVRDGHVSRGWLGVETRELNPEAIATFRLDVPADTRGVLVGGVRRDSPAARAGMKPGDVVLRVARQAVSTPSQLLNTVAALRPGAETTVSLLRGTQPVELTLKVGQRPPARPSDSDD